jgi:hypothetical protein
MGQNGPFTIGQQITVHRACAGYTGEGEQSNMLWLRDHAGQKVEVVGFVRKTAMVHVRAGDGTEGYGMVYDFYEGLGESNNQSN